jgi:hypothetical protein
MPSFLPIALSAASTPEATAAEFSKRECIHGIFHEDSGQRVEKTSRHPVALVAMVFLYFCRGFPL